LKDTEDSEKTHKNEPETRVKKTIYRAMTAKFRDVLRQSQQIQNDFKNRVQGKIKRQLRMAKQDATDEEIEKLSRNQQAAQQVIQEAYIGGRAHKKVENAVQDIQ